MPPRVRYLAFDASPVPQWGKHHAVLRYDVQGRGWSFDVETRFHVIQQHVLDRVAKGPMTDIVQQRSQQLIVYSSTVPGPSVRPSVTLSVRPSVRPSRGPPKRPEGFGSICCMTSDKSRVVCQLQLAHNCHKVQQQTHEK